MIKYSVTVLPAIAIVAINFTQADFAKIACYSFEAVIHKANLLGPFFV